MNTEVMFSSESGEWETPQWLYNLLHREFPFELDVCASHENTKCTSYFSKYQNGLEASWTKHGHLNGVCWMNPPYGRAISKWLAKAKQESEQGATVVCLVPARTDTVWWWKYCLTAQEIRFLKGRLKFGKATSGATFPSAIVIFNGRNLHQSLRVIWWDSTEVQHAKKGITK